MTNFSHAFAFVSLFLENQSTRLHLLAFVSLSHVTFTPFSHLIPIMFCFLTQVYPFTPLNNLLSFSLHGCFWYYEISLFLSFHVVLSIVCKMQIVLRMLLEYTQPLLYNFEWKNSIIKHIVLN